MSSKVRNQLFDGRRNHERGACFFVMVCWILVRFIFFLNGFPWASGLKVFWLRIFGATVGRGVVIKPDVKVHYPWKLKIGNYVWLGEEVFILNLEMVEIGDSVCLSQRAFICTGNHDFREPSMPYRNQPIFVADGVWVGASSFIAPGVSLATDCVVAAGSIMLKSTHVSGIYQGNPAVFVGFRWKGE